MITQKHPLARIIPHPNFRGPHAPGNPIVNASSAPEMYAAEMCGRQAVSVAWLWDHPDTPAYTYDLHAAGMGLDPWRLIDGVNPNMKDDGCELWFASGACCDAKMSDVIFVSKKHAVV